MKKLFFYLVLFVVAILSILAFNSFLKQSFQKEKPLVAEKIQYKTIEGNIGKNTSLSDIFAKNNLSAETLFQITTSFKNVLDFRTLKPSTTYKIYFQKTPPQNFHKLILQTSPEDIYIAIKTTANIVAYKHSVYLQKFLCSKTLVLSTNVYDAFTVAEETPLLAYQYADIFSWDIDFYLSPRVGDKIVILYEKYKDSQGAFVKYGDILAAKYIASKKTYRAYLFYESKNKNKYFTEKGTPLQKMFLKMPLHFGYLSSHFSLKRFHPVLKRYRAHTGTDYAAAYGSPIIATAEGVVIFTGWNGGYGKLIKIRHANNYITYYGHASKFLVKRGQRVVQGQVIGRVGTTGYTTGPHVHYEIRKGRTLINPEKFNTPKGKPIHKKDLARFKKRVNNYNNLIVNPPDYSKPLLPEKKRTMFDKIKAIVKDILDII